MEKTEIKRRKIKEQIVVVVGYGWVGQANALSLKMMGYPVSYFDVTKNPILHYKDKYKEVYESIPALHSVLEHDSETTCYIVSVGDRVSEDGVQDISLIESALNSLHKAKGVVVLRSTVLPDLLKNLHFDFYVPEFLHEKKAVEESLEPFFFIVGKKKSSNKEEPSFFVAWKKRAHKTFDGTPEEASYIKYLSNIWNSVRIAFVNEFGNAIARPNSKENLQSIERVTNFMFNHRFYMRYGKSFGGHCLPKDTRAFFNWYKQKGNDMSLIEGVYRSNSAHQEIEKEHSMMPEWFSEWPDRHVSAKTALQALWHSIAKRF